MFKILEELLKSGKLNQEVATTIDNEVSTQLKTLKDEVLEWQTKYKELNKTYEEVANSKTSLENQVKNLDERIAKAKEEGKKELVKELEAQKKEKEELTQKLTELETTTKNLKIENSLSKILSEYQLIDNEIVADVLKSKIDVIENEVKFRDGKPLDDGIKEFFESKPHLLKPQGNGGSGAGESGVSGFGADTLTAQLLSQAN